MNAQYQYIDDELKRLFNQCIGRTLHKIGVDVPETAVHEIKQQLWNLEQYIRDNPECMVHKAVDFQKYSLLHAIGGLVPPVVLGEIKHQLKLLCKNIEREKGLI